MSETSEHRGTGNGRADFDHSVLAELIAWRWQRDRLYFTLLAKRPFRRPNRLGEALVSAPRPVDCATRMAAKVPTTWPPWSR